MPREGGSKSLEERGLPNLSIESWCGPSGNYESSSSASSSAFRHLPHVHIEALEPPLIYRLLIIDFPIDKISLRDTISTRCPYYDPSWGDCDHPRSLDYQFPDAAT